MPTKSELCRDCGECCKFFIIQTRKPEPASFVDEWREWLKARGVEIVRENDKQWRLKIPMPCPHLDRNLESWGEGFKNYKYFCNIYENRPLVCRRFDGRLEDPHDGLACSWKTKKIEEEEKKYA